MKKGFTLAEVLVTLGVIGVVAALTVPALVGQLPCENKIRFLKAHAALTSTIADLIVDPTLYYDDNPTGGHAIFGNTKCAGLSCTGPVLNNDQNPLIVPIGADTTPCEKLARLFASRMSRNGEFNTVIEGRNFSFTTADGVSWTFEGHNNSANAPTDDFGVAKVTIDVNNNEGRDDTNASYSSQSLEDNEIIDNFEFYIDRDGGIEPVSDFESRVLADPTNLRRDDFRVLCHTNDLTTRGHATNTTLRN